MSKVVQQEVMELTRQLPYEVAEVFRFFVTPSLVEQWSAPDGMELAVPTMEARKDGKYIYKHSNEQGEWLCEGHFKDFQRNVRLIMVDNVKGPDGKQLHKDLECIVDFKDLGKGQTEVHIRQKGFASMNDLRECKQGWTQCMNKLEPVMAAEGNHHGRRLKAEELEA